MKGRILQKNDERAYSCFIWVEYYIQQESIAYPLLHITLQASMKLHLVLHVLIQYHIDEQNF